MVVVAVALAVEVLYVFVANVGLLAAKPRLAAGAPVSVTFDRAFSLFPGVLSLRGVRVSEASSWSVELAGVTVRFAPWQLVTAPRRVASVTAELVGLRVGSFDATWPATAPPGHLVARDVTLADDRLALGVDADLAGATLSYARTTFARDVKGTVKLEVGAFNPSRVSPVATASGTVALDGAFVSLAPLVSVASLATTQAPGTLHLAAVLQGGVVEPASEVRADTSHATLRDARGAGVDLPRGLALRLGVAAGKPDELELSARAKALAFTSATPGAPADSFEDVEVVAPAGSTDASRLALAPRALDWTAARVTVHEAASVLTARARGHFELDPSPAAELAASSGRLALLGVVLESPGEVDHAPFDATVTLRRFSVSGARGVTLRGDLHVTGADPRPLLELVVTSPALTSTLRSLRPRAFTLAATVDRERDCLAFDALTLAAAPLAVRGAYHRDAATSRGAFLVRGGPVPVGVTLRDGHESLTLGATDAWLAKTLGR